MSHIEEGYFRAEEVFRCTQRHTLANEEEDYPVLDEKT